MYQLSSHLLPLFLLPSIRFTSDWHTTERISDFSDRAVPRSLAMEENETLTSVGFLQKEGSRDQIWKHTQVINNN